MSLPEKIKQAIKEEHLLKTGETVIVAVSGGPDSVAMLHLLVALRYALGIRIHVAHLNHRLRKSSDKEEHFVKELAQHLKLPFTSASLRAGQLANQGSLEEAAREARFRFLIQTARKHKADAIALGHTRDDLAETVLMRILRGAGLMGLRAILPRREMNGVRCIRPLLTISRKEIETFLKKEKIRSLTDPTNKETRFFRNKIRRELLPLLETEYNPNIRSVLANLAANSVTDYSYLETQSRRALGTPAKDNSSDQIRIPLGRWKKLHPALQRMFIRLSIEQLLGSTRRLTFQHMREVEDMLTLESNLAVSALPKGITIEKKKEYLVIARKKDLIKSRDTL